MDGEVIARDVERLVGITPEVTHWALEGELRFLEMRGLASTAMSRMTAGTSTIVTKCHSLLGEETATPIAATTPRTIAIRAPHHVLTATRRPRTPSRCRL